jgi:hypothetical protein
LIDRSQQEISRMELGHAQDASIADWCACAAALGTQLAAFLERAPGADVPRDIEHLRRQNLVVEAAAAGGWEPDPESAVAGDPLPRPRSIDVLLKRFARREAVVVEVWDLVLDGGDAMRGLDAKVLATRERLGDGWHVEGLLVVRGTQRNRALVAGLRALFAAKYPAPSRACLRALGDTDATLPTGTGFAWTDVAGTRLLAARPGRRRLMRALDPADVDGNAPPPTDADAWPRDDR